MNTIGEDYTKWILNNVKDEKYIKTAIIKGKEIDALKSEGRINQIKNEFEIISKITKIKIPQKIIDYINSIKNIKIIKEEETEYKKIPEGIIISIREYVKTNNNDRIILKLPYKLTYQQIRKISYKIWVEQHKLIYIICPTKTIKGRIITDLNNYINVELIRGFEKTTEDGKIYNISSIGDSGSSVKGQKCKLTLTLRLHKYLFLSDKGINYTIFSEEKIPLGRCNLTGTNIPIQDRRRIGEEARNRTIIDLLLVSKYEPFILQITKEEIIKLKENYKTHDDIASKILGHFRHPKWFEQLIFSIIITNNNYDFPAHFLMIGPAGSGKTRGLLKPLMISFDETQGIVSGTSTIKGLIPSFKENPPKTGYLCLTEKIALIDEMFNFVKVSHRQGENNDFGMLKDVLDHEEKTFTSGSGRINTMMSSIMIAVTNIDRYNKLTSISSISEVLDKPFLSRLLLYKQSEQHINYIMERKDKVSELGKEANPKLSREFLTIIDWLNKQKIKNYDINNIKEFFNSFIKLIPFNTLEIYQGRYRHHLKCIITGITKYRWLIGEKTELIIDKEDYEIGKEIFSNIMSSWIDDDELITQLPLKTRITKLKIKEKIIYELLCQEVIKKEELIIKIKQYTNIKRESEILLITKTLIKYGLVKIIDWLNKGEYYIPYWYGNSNNEKNLTIDEVMR